MVEEFESAQVVLFTVAPPSVDAFGLWNALFGTSPTGFQTHAPGHTQANGAYGGLEINLSSQASRTDIVVSGPAPLPPAAPPVAISDPKQAIEMSMTAAVKAMSYLSLGRTAVVLQGNWFAASPEHAVQRFSELFPDIKVPAGATAVTAEYTVPMQSAVVETRRIRRLCKWQTVEAQYVNFGPVGLQVAQRFATHAYIDVYVEAVEAFTPESGAASLREIVDEAQRLIQGGPNALN